MKKIFFVFVFSNFFFLQKIFANVDCYCMDKVGTQWNEVGDVNNPTSCKNATCESWNKIKHRRTCMGTVTQTGTIIKKKKRCYCSNPNIASWGSPNTITIQTSKNITCGYEEIDSGIPVKNEATSTNL
jgi:hypothetical protein